MKVDMCIKEAHTLSEMHNMVNKKFITSSYYIVSKNL